MSGMASMIFFLPLLIQAVLMMFDEFYFHRRRGLPNWEIIGHPLDTLTVIVPLIFAYNTSFSDDKALLYVALSMFSCIFVVKDELIHKNICSKGEMILHALLYIFHPLVFMSIFMFWKNGDARLFGFTVSFDKIASSQLMLTSGFCFYQIFYWRFFYDSNHKQRHIQRAR